LLDVREAKGSLVSLSTAAPAETLIVPLTVAEPLEDELLDELLLEDELLEEDEELLLDEELELLEELEEELLELPPPLSPPLPPPHALRIALRRTIPRKFVCRI